MPSDTSDTQARAAQRCEQHRTIPARRPDNNLVAALAVPSKPHATEMSSASDCGVRCSGWRRRGARHEDLVPRAGAHLTGRPTNIHPDESWANLERLARGFASSDPELGC
jgi:hypothetical protein